MTLCIAALADEGEAIYVLNDTRLSLGYTSGEFFNKASKVHQRWGGMIAGDDVVCATPVIESVKRVVWETANPTRELIEQSFLSSIHTELVKRIEASVLAPYNLTLNEFVRTALKDMGPEAFAQLRQDIEHVKLGCEFLVFGFDERRMSHIFHIKERGVVDDHCRTGFWAIGSGDYAAISAMAFHDYQRTFDVREATYVVCMAKFMAERADLGKDTLAGYMGPDGTVHKIDAQVVRAIWEAEGKPVIPAQIADRMPVFTLLPGSRPAPKGQQGRKAPKRGRKPRPPSRG